MKQYLPELTHLQFLVLGILRAGEMSGRELREELCHNGIKKNGPSFYQMMSRLEEAKMVAGWYEQYLIDGQIIKERHYRILGNGQNAWKHARDFYERFSAEFGDLRPKYV